ncbi:ulp1 protease family protein [Colletotrichum tofieldiae]|nr:ulp1 protease family protein [Colletotrichum tofieldiae]
MATTPPPPLSLQVAADASLPPPHRNWDPSLDQDARLQRVLTTLNCLAQDKLESTIVRQWQDLQQAFHGAVSVGAPSLPASTTSTPTIHPSTPSALFRTWALQNVDRQILCIATDHQYAYLILPEGGRTKGTKGSGGRLNRLKSIAPKFGASAGLVCFLFGTEVFPGCRPALNALHRLHAFRPHCDITDLAAAYDNMPAHNGAGNTTMPKKRFREAITSLYPDAWETSTAQRARTKNVRETSRATHSRDPPTPSASEEHQSSESGDFDDAESLHQGENQAPTVPADETGESLLLRNPYDRSVDSLDVSLADSDTRDEARHSKDDDDGYLFPASGSDWSSESESELEEGRECLPDDGLSTIMEVTELSPENFVSPAASKHRSSMHMLPCGPETPFPSLLSNLPPKIADTQVGTTVSLTQKPANDDSFEFQYASDDGQALGQAQLLSRKRRASSFPASSNATKQRRLGIENPEVVRSQPKTLSMPVCDGVTDAPHDEEDQSVNQIVDLSWPPKRTVTRASRPCLQALVAAKLSLGPEQWLNDTVLNTLMGRLSGPTTAVLDSLTIRSRPTARRNSRIRDQMEGRELTMMPVNENANHWVLYTFDQKTQSLVRYDSLRQSSVSMTATECDQHSQEVSKFLRAVLGWPRERPIVTRHSEDVSDPAYPDHVTCVVNCGRTLTIWQCPQQENTWDCGLYTLSTAGKIANRVPLSAATVIDRLSLRYELYMSPTACIPLEMLHEDWMSMFQFPSGLAKWFLDYRTRCDCLRRLNRPAYFQRNDVQRILRNDARHTQQGALAAIISRLHLYHETYLEAAVEAERLHREASQKNRATLASYRDAVLLIARHPTLPLLPSLSEGERRLLASFAFSAEAIHAFITEKQQQPPRSADDNGEEEVLEIQEAEDKNQQVSDLYRMCVVHILVLRFAVARFHQLAEAQ